jgi:thiosulfate dehydrogenase
MPRPPYSFSQIAWPDIAKKPFDHPFGPYADPFPEHQHKHGPFLAYRGLLSQTSTSRRKKA